MMINYIFILQASLAIAIPYEEFYGTTTLPMGGCAMSNPTGLCSANYDGISVNITLSPPFPYYGQLYDECRVSTIVLVSRLLGPLWCHSLVRRAFKSGNFS